ncbi:cytochrome P450 [Cenococcum geophilum 1.58]|uniref:cytochrome P450 n=1 Tax=Cenococcum geophilum 1.58 TaxID=794803 RepID=UPI00358FDC00|nr:cytochrome P450 [Cenococcum geophilum 1.58]
MSTYPPTNRFTSGTPLFLSIICIVAVPFLIIREMFKPIDQRKAPAGKQWRLPPGPRGIPIFGSWLQFHKARMIQLSPFNGPLSSLSQYGEMTTLHLGPKTWVLLNSGRAISEIIAKRGAIMSEQPFPIASGLAEGRHVMHHLINGAALTYGEWQELESAQLLAAYLLQPALWHKHHFRYSNSVMHWIVLGECLLKPTPELDALLAVTIQFIRNTHYDVFRTWWGPVRSAVAAGTAPPSFMRDALLHPDTRYTGDDEIAMYLALSVISAESDNTQLALNTFAITALCHPAVFARARAEINAVCGDGGNPRLRFPCIADMPSLPFVSVVVKELPRWRPLVRTIPPHDLMQDLAFDVAVCGAVEDPEAFRPERWIDGKGGEARGRVCVGYRVAQMELFVVVARLVAGFDFVAKGPYDSRRLRHDTMDEPFPVKVSVRSKAYEELIVREGGWGCCSR